MGTVRWNVAVATETDQALRVHLASHGKSCKGDLSRFIEDAVRNRVFKETANTIKEQNKLVMPGEIDSAVDEALTWARGN